MGKFFKGLLLGAASVGAWFKLSKKDKKRVRKKARKLTKKARKKLR